MKFKVYSWREWDNNGLIEVSVDKEIVEMIIDNLENDIRGAIVQREYDKASELIDLRKVLVDKLDTYPREVEVTENDDC